MTSFDTINQNWLIRFLELRIGDKRIIRLGRKWLKAGVLEDGVVTTSEVGTGQGSVISPLLANIYLFLPSSAAPAAGAASWSNGRPGATACGRSCWRSRWSCSGGCTSRFPNRESGSSRWSQAIFDTLPCRPILAP